MDFDNPSTEVDKTTPKYISARASSDSKLLQESPGFTPPFLKKHASDRDVLISTYTRVHLKVKAETRLGEEIRCSGSTFTMGQYNPNESTCLVTTPEEYPYWRTIKPLILPMGICHRYMYATFSGGEFSRWEPIECEREIIPEGVEMYVEETYGECPERSLLQSKTESPIVYERVEMTDGSETSMEMESLSQSSSQHFPSTNASTGYKRYNTATYKPDPGSTLFLVCYHLPVHLRKKEDGSWSFAWNKDSLIARSEGSIAESTSVQWVGCITHECVEQPQNLSSHDKEMICNVLKENSCIPIFPDLQLMEHHYQGFCKRKLWPMFHNVDVMDILSATWQENFIQNLLEDFTVVWWKAYKQMNQLVADCLGGLMKSNDTIWVHDYHLLLVPSLVEEYSKKACMERPMMVFFLHIPFPTSEVFRELCNGPELLTGVLSSDVVGFHSFDHARHFLNACKRFLGLSYQSKRGGNLGLNFHGRNVVVTIAHIGIEHGTMTECLSRPQVKANADSIRAKYPGKIIICGIDSCQRLAGIPLKLLAVEQLINTSPVWRDKVVLIQHIIRSSSRVEDSNYTLQEIKTLANRINSKYGPIIEFDVGGTMALPDRMSLYLASDIMLITSVREGLNVKPLEFVFSKEEAGVVILSEFSACCYVLNGAIRINPWNLGEMTSSLDQALTMSREERQGRRARDLSYITKQPSSKWTHHVLSILQENKNEVDQVFTDMEHADADIGLSHVIRTGEFCDFNKLDINYTTSAYKSTCQRIFLLDYGGTIIDRENMSMYVKKDFTAVSGRTPSPLVMNSLEILANDPKNTVFVISGVGRKTLTRVLGHIKYLGLAAENGSMYSWPIGLTDEMEIRDEKGIPKRHWHHYNFDCNWPQVTAVAGPIFEAYTNRTNGSVLKYESQSISWNFRSADPEFGMMQASKLQSDLNEAIRDFPVKVIRKKGLVDLISEGLHKGLITRQILTEDVIRKHRHPDFILCIGDDTTDESMFKTIYDYIAERSRESVHGHQGTSEYEMSHDCACSAPLQHVFTCTVGKKASNAHLYVNEVVDVEKLLEALAGSG